MKITTLCFPISAEKVHLSIKKEGFGAGFLNAYGGKKKETDLSIEDTAVREIEEECGVIVEIKDMEKIAVIDFYRGSEHIYECHVFFFKKWKGEFRETEEMALAQGYDLNNIPFDKMWYSDRMWLPVVFSGRRIKAKIYYDNEMNNVVNFEYYDI